MFGLDDEYTGGGAYGAGKKTEHTDFAAAAGHTGAMHAKSDSIMSGGSVVRPHHYVTFLDALKQVSGMPDWDYGAAKPVEGAGRHGRLPHPGRRPRHARRRDEGAGDRSCLTPLEPLLLERRVETGDDVYVDRITADGGVWTGGTVTAEISRTASGSSAPANRAGSTRQRSRRTPSRRSVRRSRPRASSTRPRSTSPDAAVIHASREVWTADLDGRRHTSTLQARGDHTGGAAHEARRRARARARGRGIAHTKRTSGGVCSPATTTEPARKAGVGAL